MVDRTIPPPLQISLWVKWVDIIIRIRLPTEVGFSRDASADPC